jgi:hypothetical protein
MFITGVIYMLHPHLDDVPHSWRGGRRFVQNGNCILEITDKRAGRHSQRSSLRSFSLRRSSPWPARGRTSRARSDPARKRTSLGFSTTVP